MEIVGIGTDTYLYVNGISCNTRILLHENVALQPVTADFHYGKVSALLKSDVDYAVAVVSGRSIASQLHITASDAEELAISAWNAQWDCLLLGALFRCDAMCNIQSDKPVEELKNASYVNITNYTFRAVFSKPYQLETSDVEWISLYYSQAHELLEKNDSFNIAVHAMASYRWHSVLRVQLAILWSGIEALFEVHDEISFRISLCIANFLSGKDIPQAKALFKKVRALYSSRSASVHGGKIKGNIEDIVEESAELLNLIIRRCAELGALPDMNKLVFVQTEDEL